MIDSTIYFNSEQSLTYTASEVDVLADKVRLKKLSLLTDELCILSVKNGKDADRSTGAATVNANGTASLITVNSKQYYNLSDTGQPSDYYSIADTANFNITDQYCIRFKVIPLYSGAPTNPLYFFGIAQNTTNASLVQLSHVASSGTLRLEVYDSAGSANSTLSTTAWLPTANQEYEIEVNCDGTNLYIFIDGVLHSTRAYSVASGTKGRCYLGTSKAVTGLSNFYIRDFEIFNKAKHTTNFTSEIPRLVDIYQRSAIVETNAYITTEEIFELSHVVSGNLRYFLKIENDYKYLSAGNLVASDKTYSQASTMADFVANLSVINQAISVGKRIKLVPILYNGSDGNSQSFISSLSLSYDFYGTAEPFETCVVYGFIYDNLQAINTASFRVYTKKPIAMDGKIVALDGSVSPDSTGYFEIELPVNGNNVPYLYELIITDLDGKIWKDKGSILVPQQASAKLNDIKL